MNIPEILLHEIQYPLPDEKIAKYPLSNRDESKLLVYNKSDIYESVFKNISELLPKRTLLVFNNTKVIRARLVFKKETGAQIEIFCLEPYIPCEYNLSFSSNKSCSWHCLIGNAKKWKSGDLFYSFAFQGQEIVLVAKKISHQIIEFSWNASISFSDVISAVGQIPIPPYLNRNSEDIDTTRYQTVYSQHEGSVAAPTAGLHFTPELIKKLKDKNFSFSEITLHVGAGTFKPVQSNIVTQHVMHPEHIIVSKELIEKLISHDSTITPIGTTSVRSLESLTFVAYTIIQNDYSFVETFIVNQWDTYKAFHLKRIKVLETIHHYMIKHTLQEIKVISSLMIIPGFQFTFTDQLITNFHQPESTLLLLVSALVGNDWKKIYNYALENNFRFLSYGDSCLLMP